MEKRINYLVGIDISKQTFDVSLGKNSSKGLVKKTCFSNNLEGYAYGYLSSTISFLFT